MGDIILAKNYGDYEAHIKLREEDKFARYIFDEVSLKGLRNIGRVIRTKDWYQNPIYKTFEFQVLLDKCLSPRQNILFVCTANRQRSRTAHEIFEISHPHISFKSCGINAFYVKDTKRWHWERADLIHRELLDWADVIYVMEPYHRDFITTTYTYAYPIVNLNIEDNWAPHHPELVKILKEKVQL